MTDPGGGRRKKRQAQDILNLAYDELLEALQVKLANGVTGDIVNDGGDTVATAGTRVQLNGGVSLPCEIGVLVQARNANAGDIYVGGETVDSTHGTEWGPGEWTFIPVDDVSKVYIDASDDGDKVGWIAL